MTNLEDLIYLLRRPKVLRFNDDQKVNTRHVLFGYSFVILLFSLLIT